MFAGTEDGEIYIIDVFRLIQKGRLITKDGIHRLKLKNLETSIILF